MTRLQEDDRGLMLSLRFTAGPEGAWIPAQEQAGMTSEKALAGTSMEAPVDPCLRVRWIPAPRHACPGMLEAGAGMTTALGRLSSP